VLWYDMCQRHSSDADTCTLVGFGGWGAGGWGERGVGGAERGGGAGHGGWGGGRREGMGGGDISHPLWCWCLGLTCVNSGGAGGCGARVEIGHAGFGRGGGGDCCRWMFLLLGRYSPLSPNCADLKGRRTSQGDLQTKAFQFLDLYLGYFSLSFLRGVDRC
jgi:hypothetical protein